jgi:hypothetical protein
MKYLTDIVSSVNQTMLKRWLHVYSTKQYLAPVQRIKLFQFLLGKTDFDKPSPASFSMLKKRVREDMYDFILTESPAHLYKTKPGQIELKVKKAVIVIEFLASKMALLECERSIKEHLKLAEEHELYEQVVQLLQLHRGIHVYKEHDYLLEEGSRKIRCFQEKRDLLYLAKEEFYKATREGMFKDTSSLKTYHVHLQKLKECHLRSSSSRVGLMYYVLLSRYHDQQKEYEQALQASLQVKELVHRSKGLQTNANYSRAYADLSRFYLLVEDMEASVSSAELAFQYANIKFQSGLMSIEQMFRLSLYTGELVASEKYLNMGVNHRKVQGDVSHRAKWSFYEVCFLFANKKYRAALKVMELYLEKHGVSFDKEGWAFGVRLMHVMILIELRLFDKSALEIRNLHHQLKDVDNLSSRSLSIVRILDCLCKNHFEFKKSESLSQCFVKLQNEKWNPLSFELINFTAWLESKLK